MVPTSEFLPVLKILYRFILTKQLSNYRLGCKYFGQALEQAVQGGGWVPIPGGV